MQTITYLFAILAILWIVDLYQTLNITRKHGIRAEENPVARFLLKHGQKDFAAFKILDLAVLIAVLVLLFEKQKDYATYLTTIFTGIYVLTVLHNYNAYRAHKRNH
ncbi:MAG: DUF5658 family protein [Nanoarchaeota archaeon]|nr:hypothetical protein [Nanoarchaeota archaeon]MBU4299840.1 hypothetical protein [Nanoarchaeota archaeon]MBU4451689.1 hypothetical protein [Nanoarchaeota archaeon]MCG2723606.1 DUF5658 family protein [archaeon]